MFIRCILFLFLIGPITADYRFVSSSGSCAIPKLNNGRAKVRGRARIVRFICSPGYTLVGNKYSTCRNGQWDVQIPVCISTGCTPIPHVENRIQIPSYDTAWLIFFCLPGFELKGSESIYCDGKTWNASAPTCVDSKVKKQQLNCSFEDPDLCGWTNSELHDFDWQRYNEATPSSFLKTGPSYDHTLGKGKLGYYMYIESTSRYEKDVAWLLSPVYDRNLLKDGCFSFYYHMYGNATGRLKVYIKPDFLDLNELMKPGDLNNKYNLFDKSGNKGNFWYNSVTPLPDVRDNFQIVIEGIRGSSYTSDIAIDDVAILQGSDCTAALAAATSTTPAPVVYYDSCIGRCDINGTANKFQCSCSASCFLQDNCCVDFFDTCIFAPDSSGEATTVSEIVPQTQKLIATSTPETTSTSTTTSSSTTMSTTSTTPKPTTTTTTTTSTTTTPRTTIKTTQKATTIKANTKSTSTTTQKPSSIKPVAKTTKKSILTTTKITTIPTTVKATTQTTKTKPYTTSTTTTITPKTTKSTTHFPYGISRTIENHNDYHDILEKARKEKEVELRKIDHLQSSGTQKSGSSGWKVLLIIITIVACMGAVSWMILVARTSRGRETIARLRGHIIHDPEVRFLSTDVDDD